MSLRLSSATCARAWSAPSLASGASTPQASLRDFAGEIAGQTWVGNWGRRGARLSCGEESRQQRGGCCVTEAEPGQCGDCAGALPQPHVRAAE
mmetsp:Transcript_21786/g.60548  ORF Transcript_21786/g.60548 Transcript_21786/m.60548 type:complete len:93 (+) Transcript_21786:47-325(+)